ncbi:MAG: hypothetical protein K940chlam8_01255 [Chlamydiae bacterium]|nr:hypothetical protein [Chlamydiota bacterium]
MKCGNEVEAFSWAHLPTYTARLSTFSQGIANPTNENFLEQFQAFQLWALKKVLSDDAQFQQIFDILPKPESIKSIDDIPGFSELGTEWEIGGITQYDVYLLALKYLEERKKAFDQKSDEEKLTEIQTFLETLGVNMHSFFYPEESDLETRIQALISHAKTQISEESFTSSSASSSAATAAEPNFKQEVLKALVQRFELIESSAGFQEVDGKSDFFFLDIVDGWMVYNILFWDYAKGIAEGVQKEYKPLITVSLLGALGGLALSGVFGVTKLAMWYFSKKN